MRCPKCGAELSPSAKFCGKCGTILSESSGYSSSGPTPPTPKPSKSPFVPSGVNRMPQGIALGVGERIVKQYKIGRYTFRQGSVNVIVTNKRVIRYEESIWLGLKNNQIDEINIDAVHGVSISMMRSISVLGTIFAIIFIIIGITGLASLNSYGRYGSSPVSQQLLPVVGFGAAILILMNSFKPSLIFYLHGAIGGEALSTCVNLRGRFFGKNATGGSAIFQFKPTPETTEMLKEIGACVYDLKTLGDSAISKWC